MDRLKDHTSRERKNSIIEDRTLIGYLNLISKLIQKIGIHEIKLIADQKGLMEELFNKCLFPDDAKPLEQDITEDVDTQRGLSGNKCKTKESRSAAFTLLWTLCKNSPLLLDTLLRNCMVPLVERIERYKGWNYIPASDARSSGFVGLRNLGCICYMNSMIQQFFMIPSFRY